MNDRNAGTENVIKWFFCFKQVRGQWIVRGPYEKYDEAAKARNNDKARDVEVGNVFSAYSKEEAEARCESGMTG